MGQTWSQREPVPEPPPEEDCETWDTPDLLRLFESGDGSDFVLVCGNDKFPVHSDILIERSEVFDAMFQSSGDDTVLLITDVAPNTLEDMLRFIYSGQMPAYRAALYTMKLYDAGNKYEINALKKKCLNLLKKNINEDDACEILLFAENRKIGKLKDIAVPYLADRKQFLLSETFKIFSASNPELAIEVLIAFVRKTP